MSEVGEGVCGWMRRREFSPRSRATHLGTKGTEVLDLTCNCTVPLGSRADSSLARPGPCLPHNDHHPGLPVLILEALSLWADLVIGHQHLPRTSDYLDAILPLSDLLWASVYRTATLHACCCRLLLLLVLPTNLSWPRPTRFIEAHWHTADHPIQKIRSSRPQQSTPHTQSTVAASRKAAHSPATPNRP